MCYSAALFLCGCASSNTANYFNYSNSKNIGTNLTANYSIVQTTVDSIVIFYEIDINELLFSSKNKQDYTARLKFHWKLFPNNEGKQILLQDSLLTSIEKPATDITHIYGALKIKTPITDAFIALKTSDLNRKSSSFYSQNIYRDNNLKYTQYYQIKRDNGTPLINPYCKKGDPIQVYAPRHSTNKLFVFEITPEDNPAEPPYFGTTNNFKNHELRNLRIIIKDSVLNTYRFKMNPSKISLLVGDTTNPIGQCVFQFPEAYPKQNSYTELLNPLYYLCTKTEYAELVTSINKREAFERFWESHSGNKERAKTLIKYYYKRVEKANTYFTSYKEGWRTDRGMILIVFGEPENIKGNSKYETWTYGKGENTATLSFTFEKIPNRLSSNDYVLIRNPNYRNIWNSAISTWRSGRYFIF